MRYFKEDEFVMGRVNVFDKMNAALLSLLDQLREDVGFALKINSSYRSKEHNDSIGGAKFSKHLTGQAVDISCKSSHDRAIIVGCAIKLGLTVGVANTFVHIDNREGQIMFTY